jgi:hypothetical protein
MTTLNTEIPAEKRELNDELTPDELEVVSGGWLAWSAWVQPDPPPCFAHLPDIHACGD